MSRSKKIYLNLVIIIYKKTKFDHYNQFNVVKIYFYKKFVVALTMFIIYNMSDQ